MIQILSIFIYNFSILLYSIVIKFSSFFNPKAKLFINGRKNILNEIEKKFANSSTENIWFHCASLGEFEQARPLIESIRKSYPNYKIILTFFSPSGYEIRKNYPLADYIFYLPFDTKKNAGKVISFFKPKMVFFIKYEFWFHYINTLSKHKIPVYLVSAVFRNDQLFFKWYGKFFLNILKKFTVIFTQNESSKNILIKHKINGVIVSNDTRFDRVYQNAENVEKILVIERFKQNKKIILFGSSYETEEEFIQNYLQQFSLDCKIIIAPHFVEKSNIQRISKLFQKQNCIIFSEATLENVKDKNVLIMDNVGYLASAYQYADIAIVGGGFKNIGLHNILEPAAFGMPILIGPANKMRYPEIIQFAELGVLYEFTNQKTFNEILNKCFQKNLDLLKIKNISKEFVKSNLHSTQIIMGNIFGKTV